MLLINKKSLFIFILFFINQININAAELKIINIEEINKKTEYFKNILGPKQNIKKAIYLTSATVLTIGISYLGYNYWKAYKQNQKDSNNSESKIQEEPENNSEINIKIKEKDNLGLYGFSKGLNKGLTLSIASLVIIMGSRSLDFLVNNLINFFNLKEHEHFLKINENISSSLEHMQIIFSINNEKCFKEEVVDSCNYFTENLENLLAITNFLSIKKLNQINNYQTLKSSQELIVKKYLIFLEQLKVILEQNNKPEYFDETDAKNIWPQFKELNNQIFRFIKLCDSILYEN
ncbi:hypothetical protein KJ644_03585 [Candidatus Dependentiae bacterium]|nr:hypothetical protein [Candidatus Dependentiae bacterium]MBU4387529.1 hypothetical protein [Candidatus Dependentiae bacterium]